MKFGKSDEFWYSVSTLGSFVIGLIFNLIFSIPHQYTFSAIFLLIIFIKMVVIIRRQNTMVEHNKNTISLISVYLATLISVAIILLSLYFLCINLEINFFSALEIFVLGSTTIFIFYRLIIIFIGVGELYNFSSASKSQSSSSDDKTDSEKKDDKNGKEPPEKTSKKEPKKPKNKPSAIKRIVQRFAFSDPIDPEDRAETYEKPQN